MSAANDARRRCAVRAATAEGGTVTAMLTVLRSAAGQVAQPAANGRLVLRGGAARGGVALAGLPASLPREEVGLGRATAWLRPHRLGSGCQRESSGVCRGCGPGGPARQRQVAGPAGGGRERPCLQIAVRMSKAPLDGDS